MIAYSPRQLVLLLGLVLAAGAGLAIGEWRRAKPEIAAALEALDRAHDDDRALMTSRAPAAPRPTPVAVAPPPAAPAARRDPVDINRATVDDLTRLPGIGPVLAARIVAARESGGAFESVDDLRRVAGVGAAKLAAFRDRVTVSR
jgi:competence protein ComEA